MKSQKRNLRNNKGGLYALMLGLMMVAGGMLMFILVNVIFEGATESDTGLFAIAENDFGLAADTTYLTIKNTWQLLPLAFVAGGIITIIINSLFRDYQSGYVGGGNPTF